MDKGYDYDHLCRCLRQPGTTSPAQACGQVPGFCGSGHGAPGRPLLW